MIDTAFDSLSRTASRRDSLLALGGAGLVAAFGDVAGAAAKSKSGKRRKKKCKNPCQSQVSQCTLTINLTCNAGNDPEACKEAFLPCCDLLATCSAGEMLQCILT
jgi:hypothetical protein